MNIKVDSSTGDAREDDLTKLQRDKIERLMPGFLGCFVTYAQFVAKYPTGSAGQYAYINATGTYWDWDTSSNAWVDTGSAISSYTKAEVDALLALKQAITDGTFTTAAKTVPGAVNELNSGKQNVSTLEADVAAKGFIQSDATGSDAKLWTQKGTALEVFGSDGKILAAKLPSYVDDIIEVNQYEDLPQPGESGKIYVVLSGAKANRCYRWGGTVYTEVSPSLVIGTIAGTAFDGGRGLAAETGLASHIANTSNPHAVTKAQVGLGNVDNTSDADKPISSATQAALNEKIEYGEVVNALDSTETNLPLSANMGKTLKDALELKQDATDNSLTTTAKTVSGAINELHSGKLSRLDLPVRENSTSYTADARAAYPGKYGYMLKCTQSGDSGTTVPAWPASIISGSTVLNDGTAKWTIYDMAEGGSSESDLFVITASPSGSGSLTGTFDKTAAEMRSAIASGKELIVKLTSGTTVYTYTLLSVTDDTTSLMLSFFRSISGNSAPSDEVMDWYSDSSTYNLHAREGEPFFRYYTMPAASAEFGNLIVQFVGTTSDYTQGHFYKAVEDSGTYSWQEVSLGGGTGDYIPRVTAFPTASATSEVTVEYIGTDTTYIYGALYKLAFAHRVKWEDGGVSYIAYSKTLPATGQQVDLYETPSFLVMVSERKLLLDSEGYHVAEETGTGYWTCFVEDSYSYVPVLVADTANALIAGTSTVPNLITAASLKTATESRINEFIPMAARESVYFAGSRVYYKAKYSYVLVAKNDGWTATTLPDWPSEIQSGVTTIYDGGVIWVVWDLKSIIPQLDTAPELIVDTIQAWQYVGSDETTYKYGQIYRKNSDETEWVSAYASAFQDFYDGIFPIGFKFYGDAAPGVPTGISAAWMEEPATSELTCWRRTE